MTSLMRDTYVEIEGHGKTKLNHAYSYGGPELSIKTINKNFGLDIKEFVAVDFYEFADIIDELDGVTVDIKKDEIKPLNTCIRGIENLRKTSVDKIYEPGTYTLNGDQAVAYCRVRHTAGGDYERAERQRFVLSELFNKMKNMNKKDFIKMVPKLASKVETSMGYSEIMKLGIQVFTSDINVIEQKRFPLDEHSYGKFIGEIWYLITDIAATKEEINKFIYN